MPAIKNKPLDPKSERTSAIGKRITDMRMELGMTQRKLGTETDINRVSIFMFESGRYIPNMTHTMALAEALQTTPVYILTGNGPRWKQKDPLPWKTLQHSNGRLYCPYCGKGNGYMKRELEWNGLPLPNYCAWCGRKIDGE